MRAGGSQRSKGASAKTGGGPLRNTRSLRRLCGGRIQSPSGDRAAATPGPEVTRMSDHFAAFSFVDRITEYEPGRRARGSYFIPSDIAAFPSCLVAEAVGQLAAWVAMAQLD